MDEQETLQQLMDDLAGARQRVADLESAVLDEMARAHAAAREDLERQVSIKEAMVEASVAGLALWDSAGCIRYGNPAFLAMWGYDTSDEVEGCNIEDLLADDHKVATIGQSVEQSGGWIGKLTGIGRDGSPFTVMLSVSRIQEDHKHPSYAVGSFVEMTYRERLNAMLFRQSDWLEALHAVNRGILSARPLTEIIMEVLTALRQMIPYTNASVTLFDTEEETAQLLASLPSAEGTFRRPPPVSLTGAQNATAALKQGEIYALDEATHPPLPAKALGLESQPDPGAYLLVPLSYADRLLGALTLVRRESTNPKSWHQSMINQVADALAVAVHHAQLTDELAALSGRGRTPSNRRTTS